MNVAHQGWSVLMWVFYKEERTFKELWERNKTNRAGEKREKQN